MLWNSAVVLVRIVIQDVWWHCVEYCSGLRQLWLSSVNLLTILSFMMTVVTHRTENWRGSCMKMRGWLSLSATWTHLWKSVRVVIQKGCTRKLVVDKSEVLLGLTSHTRSHWVVSWWLSPVKRASMSVSKVSSHSYNNEYVFTLFLSLAGHYVWFILLLILVVTVTVRDVQCESKKIPPLRGPDIFHFFHKRLRIFNRFFYTPITRSYLR